MRSTIHTSVSIAWKDHNKFQTCSTVFTVNILLRTLTINAARIALQYLPRPLPYIIFAHPPPRWSLHHLCTLSTPPVHHDTTAICPLTLPPPPLHMPPSQQPSHLSPHHQSNMPPLSDPSTDHLLIQGGLSPHSDLRPCSGNAPAAPPLESMLPSILLPSVVAPSVAQSGSDLLLDCVVTKRVIGFDRSAGACQWADGTTILFSASSSSLEFRDLHG